MRLINSHRKKTQVMEPNTFIGGIGATTTTASQLEILLGLSSGDVQNFSIDGSNNIECTIVPDYTFPDAVFNANTEITHYRDPLGKCTIVTGADHFVSCDNLDHLVFSFNLAITPEVLSCSNLSYLHFPNALIISSIRECTVSGEVDISSAHTVNGYCFYRSVIKYISFSSLTNILANSFREMEGCEYFDLKQITSLPTTSIYDLDNTECVMDLRGLTSVSSGSPSRFTSHVRKMFLNELTVHQFAPNNSGSPAHYVIGKATQIGTASQDYSVVTNNFLQWTPPTGGGKVYVHSSMATINAGGPSADMNLLTSVGFTVVYVSDYTNPSEVSDLAVTNITATTADFTFTTPSTTNAYQHLDVYLDFGDGRGFIHRWNDEIVTTGDTISNLPSGTEIKAKVIAVDEFYNMSDFSNEVTFTTL